MASVRVWLPPARSLWALALLGLALRLSLVTLAPRYGFFPDHVSFAAWGIQALEGGYGSVYEAAPPSLPFGIWDHGRWRVVRMGTPEPCNYPPLFVLLLSLSARWVVAAKLGINGFGAHLLFSSWSIVGDFVLAAGAAAVARRVGCERAGLCACAILLLAPPFAWDSSLWGQTESLFLAPGMWMLRALLDRRWLIAAALLTVAGGLKTQAVLLLPIWIFALAGAARCGRSLAAVASAAGVVMLGGLLYSALAGPSWLHASYLQSIFEKYPETTLHAFNVWSLDRLLGGASDSSASWLGLTKDLWGRALLGGALIVFFFRLLRRCGSDPRGLVLWAAIELLACVMLPTRVHERYLVLALPFLVAASFVLEELWPATYALLGVSLVQLSWPLWDLPGRRLLDPLGPEALAPPLEGGLAAWACTLLALGAAVWVATCAWRARWPHTGATAPVAGPGCRQVQPP